VYCIDSYSRITQAGHQIGNPSGKSGVKPLTSPQALNAPVADLPTGISQQSGDPTIAVSTILSRQFNHVGDKPVFICTAPWLTSLCGPMLAKDTADQTL